ncbi:eukaryotic translation initiation factor 5B [Sitodiplosis mosellana]|uniref:eukaryotic translation initiation factor 5B n=1 Tax=Sitodiplosis mosellana TaxID=263140 RepID=UPI002443B116|nr:eukaryotic translation initiation factor 5B [Sitodiplosis mosellana]
MGKAKKGKKEIINEDESKTNLAADSDSEPEVTVTKTKEKKPNKKVKAATSESESEVEETTTKPSKKAKEPVKKGKGNKKKNANDSDVEMDGGGKKPGFSLLLDDDSDDDDINVQPEPQSDDEDLVIAKTNKKKNQSNAGENAGNKKGKKAKKKRNDSDEDIDAMLAELALEYAGEKPPPTAEKKQEQPEAQDDNEDGEDSAAKSAAQKKKEKKERQKLKQQQEKQQQQSTETDATNEDTAAAAPPTKKEKPKKKEKEMKATPTEEVEAGPSNETVETTEGTDDKKKKKKGKADKKEEETKEKDKKKKGPSQAMVAAMQERLQKIKEEEERQKREAEEKMRQHEEIERLRLEKVRLEAERKEKKKQREKERKERLKAEGKLLTTKQKQDQARAQAMLESLRAQGIELPEAGAKKPRPGTRIRPNKKNQQQANQTPSEEKDEQKFDEASAQSEGKTETAPEPSEEEKVKDSWDASSSEDESSEVTEPEPAKSAPTTASKAPNKDATSEDSESEDSDESDDGSDDEESEDEDTRTEAEIKKEKAWQRIMKRRHAAEQKKTLEDLRAAVVCVLGHVDTGKTKILDKLRRTHVQDSEAGGITQQIGATNVPVDAIKEQCKVVKGSADMVYKLPGLLIIDTPGHESFSNLRTRGSSLCDIAILVVDIMHGLEPQTIESINILKSMKTPFLVALNKIDRLYDWQTINRKDVRDILKSQAINTQNEFEKRTKDVILQFAEQGLNAALFYENPDPRSYINLVPTSAITGEGMGNLLYLIVESCQTWLAKRLMYSEELQATVLEVKAISGLGTTIDCILINGKLREGETMVVAGTDGPITTQIRSLLMPEPLKELRVKNAYKEYKEIKGAQGVKIAAKELEKAIAGLNVYIAHKPDEVDICREEVAKELRSALSHIKLSSEGVYVQASTLGSLEALLEFLRTSKIPYSNIRIGPVVKRDVMKASIMLEHDASYATILAFDVKVERDAQELADSVGVKIFQADIIYHLFDKFTAYREELKAKKREEFKTIAVFPCKLKILPQFIFNSRDPIVMGVMVESGIVKEGTPICVPSKEFLDIGVVTSIECNHKQVESARKGQEVCIKIEPIPGESPKMYGRHFEDTDMLVSKISRQSIDACKDYFREDLNNADWKLMIELKKLFQIL